MGTFTVEIQVGDIAGTRVETLSALVDTGASYTVLPARTLQRLSIERTERRSFVLADERRREYDVGLARITIDGRSTISTVVFGDDATRALLGAVTLEAFGLAVDPLRRRLVPVEGLMMRLAIR